MESIFIQTTTTTYLIFKNSTALSCVCRNYFNNNMPIESCIPPVVGKLLRIVVANMNIRITLDFVKDV